jgi:hypothetical protein
MLWIYARGEQSLRLETRFDNETAEFVLIIYPEDGSPRRVERFKDTVLFRERLAALEDELESERWHLDGTPVLLRDGWKI